jgi:hypothetical protein
MDGKQLPSGWHQEAQQEQGQPLFTIHKSKQAGLCERKNSTVIM